MFNIQSRLAKNQKIYEDFLISRKKWVGSKTGEVYYSYLIKSELKGEEVTVNFRCPKNDPIGYKNLERVFKDADKVYLLVQTDTGFNGLKTYTYCAVSFDNEGLPTRGNILPAASSDRNLLEDILARADYYDRLRRQEAADEILKENDDQVTAPEPDGDIDEELIEMPDDSGKGKKSKKAE